MMPIDENLLGMVQNHNSICVRQNDEVITEFPFANKLVAIDDGTHAAQAQDGHKEESADSSASHGASKPP